jgi:hypothetical protein
MIDGARLGDDQRGAALHAAAVVLAQPVVRGPVNAPVALHARHDEPVPELKAANPERLVKRCDVVVGCRCRGLVKLGHAPPLPPNHCAFNLCCRLPGRLALLLQETWLEIWA